MKVRRRSAAPDPAVAPGPAIIKPGKSTTRGWDIGAHVMFVPELDGNGDFRFKNEHKISSSRNCHEIGLSD